MKKGFSKEDLVESLEETVLMTREDITALKLEDQETVVIIYESGYKKKVNIACNSGIAIVRDIAKNI